MLDRALTRCRDKTDCSIQCIQDDIREVTLKDDTYDCVFAAAVFHHLRGTHEWVSVFNAVYKSMKKGGALFISDLICHDHDAIDALMWDRYGDYLIQLNGEAYKQTVFDYIEEEDSPRSVMFQCDLLKKVGFSYVDVLHKHALFSAIVAIK